MVVLEPSRDPMSLSDTFSVFFDDGGAPDHDGVDGDSGSDEESSVGTGSAESKAFWEAQHQLLQESLNRSSSIERRIRTEMEEANSGDACRNGSLRAIRDWLRDAGYDSALCKSKWRKSPDIPSGEHEYVDVVVDPKAGGNRKSPIRVVIELSFRAEFEMARASEEYTGLVRRLPLVFVGKAEKLRSVVKIMCSAAKKCMKENRMHIAPWRKHKYMQSKWFAACSERMSAAAPELRQAAVSDRQPKMRASMLTIDLHRNAPQPQMDRLFPWLEP